MIKKIKTGSLLTAVLVFGSFASLYSAPKEAVVRPVLETLVQFRDARLNVAPPAAPPLAAVPDASAADRQRGAGGCTPSAAIIPGTDFSPRISDPVRTTAIISLLAKIAVCKPLPYDHDGIVNSNYQGGMPQAPAGFYKEYTLMVPGRNTGDGPVPVVVGGQTYMTGPVLSTRGPERILVGGGREIYYTPDHYKTFIHLKIVK